MSEFKLPRPDMSTFRTKGFGYVELGGGLDITGLTPSDPNTPVTQEHQASQPHSAQENPFAGIVVPRQPFDYALDLVEQDVRDLPGYDLALPESYGYNDANERLAGDVEEEYPR